MNEMNEMNELEAQLRSWRPRRPYRKFERARRNAPNRSSTFCWADWPGLSGATLARALAPVVACLLLTAAILMQPGQGLITPNSGQPAMIALALSNQNFAPYLTGSFQSTANRWDTFGWTNESGSPSSMRSLTPPEAIDLQ